MEDLKGQWALVTGASSGIGKDIADLLAARGANIIAVARREERLKELCGRLEQNHGVKTELVSMDLAEPGAPEKLYKHVRDLGINVDILINNAGFGIYGQFVGIPWEEERELLQLNMVNLTHLTRLFVDEMIARDHGYILQVSSVAAYQPAPGYAIYAASKSYVLNFSEPLNWELRNTGVSVSVLSPGAVRTEFLEVAGQAGDNLPLIRLTSMSSRRVAEIAVKGMLRRKSSIVPGWHNWLTVFSTRFTPRSLLIAVGGWIMRDANNPRSARVGANS